MAPPAEISIPTTSLQTPADKSSKPYTLYNITLRLPLRSFVQQKRYSDFAKLHDALRTAVGEAPPAPLPSKSWFKSTVSSPELTEDRRRGLETYLRAIAESPDRRWRDTPAWRAFMQLPGGINSAGNSAASVRGARSGGGAGGISTSSSSRGDAAGVAAVDPGTWLDLHKEMKSDLQEARRCLARRDAATDQAGALEAGAAAKRALVKAASLITALGDGLRAMAAAAEGGKRVIGEGEVRRRKDLLSAARVDRDDLDKLSSSLATAAKLQGSSGPPSASDKSALLGSAAGSRTGGGGGRVLGGGTPVPETERTRELDNRGVAQLQQQMMTEQDQDVDALTRIVRRQREMALEINREVVEQTEMVDRLNEDVDRVHGKVNIAKKRTKNLR